MLLVILSEAQILKDLVRWNDIGCAEGKKGKKAKEFHNKYLSGNGYDNIYKRLYMVEKGRYTRGADMGIYIYIKLSDMISYSYRLPENETDMTTMAEHDAIMNLMY